ncbi:MAG: hypothetical protein GOV00_01255 [Candidatus Altiarchaeota archaeon]|nr:hypothetical protein [Candidatus Altiarchaeota archaeon]
MSDFVTSIVNTPYLIVPVFLWLWQMAKFPRIDANKMGVGVLLTLSGLFMYGLANAFAPYAGEGWGIMFAGLFSFLAILLDVLGLVIIGVFAVVEAINLWKF